MKRCEHTKEESWWLYDGRGIPLGRVCEKCEEETIRKYRPEIFKADYDVGDERIEDDY